MEKITKSSDTVLIDPNEPLILPDGTALVGRIEWFLYALCCLDYQNLPTPMSRIEEFANALITGEIPNIEPQSRAEQFFLAILDGNVSNLPQPQSRSEVLLDKLARGEFDLSDVEPIQSHYELLLAYLIKNGGIGNIDYVLYEFSEAMKTMYNTIEKPFKSLELSGNTLVNCVLEDTENDDYTSFDKDYSGTSFTINGTSEGAIKSAILTGQTLVNLMPKLENGNYSVNGSNTVDLVNNEYKIYHSTSSNNYIKISRDVIAEKLKQNTDYTLIVNITESTITNQNAKLGISTHGNLSCIDGTNYVSSSRIDLGNAVGYFKEKIRLKETLASNRTSDMYFCFWDGTGNDTEYVKFKIMIIEGDHTQEDIPYFEGMQSVKMPVLTTTGKNLFDFNDLELGSINLKNGEPIVSDNARRNKNFINVYGIDKFTLSMPNYIKSNGARYIIIHCYDSDKRFLGFFALGDILDTYPNRSFLENTNFIKVTIQQINTKPSDVFEIQLEKGPNATAYEPFKTNILTTPQDLELRGIGDVQDTLDLLTGEATERIGEIVLDGSENWSKQGVSQNNSDLGIYYSTNALPNTIFNTNNVLCDKFKTSKTMAWHSSEEDIYVSISTYGLKICFDERKLESTTVEGFKKWLSENTPTIQYPLVEKPIKTVDLNVVDQNNNKIDKIHVFDEVTHVNASSDELTPTVNIGKSVSYPTIIKPNTKYTVDLKRNNKPLTVDLGGTEVTFTDGETRKTITTPSTLVNDKLSYYGIGAKCNEIMLIEGEIERNVNYFTGMQSVVVQNQMPILSTVGKNLFKGFTKYDYSIDKGVVIKEITDNSLKYITNGVWNSSIVFYIPITSGKNYIMSADMSNVVADDFYFVDELKQVIGGKFGINKSVTSPTNAKFIKWHVRNSSAVADCLISNFQLEENSVTTQHEPYKTSILSCNEEVTLRGIGDVQDTLDCLTGEVNQRVSEFILDKNTTISKYTDIEGFNTTGYNVKLPTNFVPSTTNFICNSLPKSTPEKIQPNMSPVDEEGIAVNVGYIKFRVSNEKGANVEDFKKYLEINPIKLIIPLVEESIKSIDLNAVDQDGNTIPKIKSYKDVTHLEVTVPKQSLLPNISAEVATDNSKDMSSLAEKHQEISEAQLVIQNSIQSQSDEIDTAMMATTEIFESILE